MMPRRKRDSSPMEFFEDDFDEDNSSQGGNPPIQRNAANARERARMRVLSSAFGRLKTKLPNIPPDTKLSKLDTLRLATIYIKQLKTIVDGGEHNVASNEELINETLGNSPTHNGSLSIHNASGNMSWPFGFYHHLQHQHSHYKSHTTSCNNTLLHSTPTWFTTTTSLRSPENMDNNTTAINKKFSSNQLKIQNNLKNSQHSWYSVRSDQLSPEIQQYTKSIEVQNEKYYHQQSCQQQQQQQYSQYQHHGTLLTQSWRSSHELQQQQHQYQLQQQQQQQQCYSQQGNRSQQQRPPYLATFSNLSNLTNTGLK